MNKFPQPTQAELDETDVYYISLNPFWWSIVQGLLAQLANPERWENYTQELDEDIQELMNVKELD